MPKTIQKAHIIDLLAKTAKLQAELTTLLQDCEENHKQNTTEPAGGEVDSMVIGKGCANTNLCID